MATELKILESTSDVQPVTVTRYFSQTTRLQLTQGLGGLSTPGYVQLDKAQAVELIKTLTDYIAR